MIGQFLPFLIILSAIFWSSWHYYRDYHSPEPIWHLLGTLFLGFLSAQLAGVIHEQIPTPIVEYSLGFFTYSVFGIGFIEEICKFIPFLLVCTRFKEYNELVDGVIYASMIGIGFALNESFYFFKHEPVKELVLARTIVSPITHALFASIFGHFHFTSILKRNPKFIFLGIFLASFIHGLYDFFSLQDSAYAPIIAALVVLVLWIWRILLFKKLKEFKNVS